MALKDIIHFIVDYNLLTAALLFLTVLELSQSRKTRTADTLYNVFKDIHHSEFLKETEWLYTYDTEKSYSEIDSADRRRLDDIIDTFTRIGYLCERRCIGYDDVVNMYSGLIVHVWKKAKPYIYEKRHKSGVGNYACYFETLYNKAIKYRKEKQIGSTIY